MEASTQVTVPTVRVGVRVSVGVGVGLGLGVRVRVGVGIRVRVRVRVRVSSPPHTSTRYAKVLHGTQRVVGRRVGDVDHLHVPPAAATSAARLA